MATLDDSSDFPNTELIDPEDDQAISKLVRYLQKHIQKRHLLREEGNQKQINFRNTLVQLVREYESLKHCNNEQKLIISTLEGRVCKLQNQIDGLLCKLNSACEAMRSMQQEVNIFIECNVVSCYLYIINIISVQVRNRDKQLKEQEIERQRIIQKYNARIEAEANRITKEMEIKLRKQQEWFESCIKKKDDKLKLVGSILSSVHDNASDNVLKAPTASGTESVEESISNKISSITSAESQVSKSLHCEVRQNMFLRARINGAKERTVEKPIPMISKKSSRPKTEVVQESLPTTSIDPSPSTIASTDNVADTKTKLDTKMTKRVAYLHVEIKRRPSRRCKIPVVNPRYRAKSGDKWIDHRPAGIVPIGTIMQPQTQPHKQTVQKLTNPKTFRKKSAKYCLFAQEQDTDGELETKLYKADVLPTCGGGAQIVFNDIEYLKQISPSTAK
ncbi:kinesin-like protein KIF23 isoform X3 [Linepithema humile]|uniref:kinesin-like protein KIF23 isoform X3 n=1 Tax=Linepithema humile TaxID=83485 RepID=UPI00351F2C11